MIASFVQLIKKNARLFGIFKIKKHLFFFKDKQRINKEFSGEKRSFGSKFPDKEFYVIRRQPPGGGLMSNYLHVVGHIKIALENRMIPVVDMQNYKTFYNEEQSVNGSFNPWEYYFRQPFPEYSLNDVYSSKNVTLSSFEFPHHVLDYSMDGVRDVAKVRAYNDIINSWVKINPEIDSLIKSGADLASIGKCKVLGVSVRGTDYSRLRPAGHPIQPSTEDLIDIVKSLKAEWSFERILLATEEEAVVDSFKSAFPEQVFAIDRMRLKAKDHDMHTKYRPGEFVGAARFERPLDKYKTGLEYLTEIVLLSRCDYLLTGLTSGAAAAVFINGNKYIDKRIIDLGVY